MRVRLCVLVSGSGTILEAMVASGVAVDLVAADRPCRGLEVATAAGIEAVLVDRADYGGFRRDFDRDGYTRALVAVLAQRDINLIAMAGFGTVTSGVFFEAFPGRVLNTHPSLLPDFKGWHAVAQALESGATRTGCTVHVATVELDDGPILAQVAVDILDDDDEHRLHERIKTVERELYPQVVTRVKSALEAGEPVTSVVPQ